MERTPDQPILTVFAGPNGSGKSTITRQFQQEKDFPSNYINPDVITANLPGDASNYLERSRQAQQIAEQQRQDFIANRESFSFETVMSHPSKLAIMEQAKESGYYVNLVFVSTDDSQLNVDRVAQRVQHGGHDVPADKIVSRYDRSLELLPKAIEIADQATLIDNSQMLPLQGARLQNGTTLQQVENSPAWINQSIATVQERAQERVQLLSNATEQNMVLQDAKLDGAEYVGIIKENTPHYAVQQVDEGTLILHDRTAGILNRPVEVGQTVQINYREGVGNVQVQQSIEQENDDNGENPPPSAPIRPRLDPQGPSGGISSEAPDSAQPRSPQSTGESVNSPSDSSNSTPGASQMCKSESDGIK
jgi:predicted ABC-type ATPase